MYLNKIKLFLVISFFLSSFFLTLKDVKSYEIKIVDGDTKDIISIESLVEGDKGLVLSFDQCTTLKEPC